MLSALLKLPNRPEKETMMYRLLALAVLCLGVAFTSLVAQAKIPDPGPPYTEE